LELRRYETYDGLFTLANVGAGAHKLPVKTATKARRRQVWFLDELCPLEKSSGPLNPTLAPLFAHEAALSQFAQYFAGK
jgi:hypothetical protein